MIAPWFIPAAIGFLIGYSGIADNAIENITDRDSIDDEPNLVPSQDDKAEITPEHLMEPNMEQGGNLESSEKKNSDEPEGQTDIPRDNTHEETMRMCVDCREENPALGGKIP